MGTLQPRMLQLDGCISVLPIDFARMWRVPLVEVLYRHQKFLPAQNSSLFHCDFFQLRYIPNLAPVLLAQKVCLEGLEQRSPRPKGPNSNNFRPMSFPDQFAAHQRLCEWPRCKQNIMSIRPEKGAGV